MKKIEVLKKAIQMLEGGFPYSWFKAETCNCGVVVRAMGVSDDMDTAGYGIWKTKTLSGECPITGLKLSTIQRTLVESGFTKKDIWELEKLSNKTIAEKIGETVIIDGNESFMSSKIGVHGDFKYTDKATLIKYLRAWVSILEEQTAKETPEVKTVIVRVAVPVTISKQAEQLILS